jgi:hypothetical protein
MQSLGLRAAWLLVWAYRILNLIRNGGASSLMIRFCFHTVSNFAEFLFRIGTLSIGLRIIRAMDVQ